MWEKKYKSVLTNIWKARMSDDKLCLLAEELSNPSFFHLVVLDLRTEKDLSNMYRQELMKFGTVYPFQIYKTKLVLRGGAEFYILDLK